MSSRKRTSRIGGGTTCRSEAPPTVRASLEPPASLQRAPRTGRRAGTGSSSVPASQRSAFQIPASGGATPLSTGRRSTTSRYDPTELCVRRQTPSARMDSSRQTPLMGSARSMPRRQTPLMSQEEMEAAVNKEIGRIVTKVDKDVGFNKQDEQESYEAAKIITNDKPDQVGLVPVMDRIREEDLDGDGMIQESEKFVNQRSHLQLSAPSTADPVKDGTWRDNRNPYLKWWQGKPVEQIDNNEAKIRGLNDIPASHPAYFLMRRREPTMAYVREPVFKTRTDLMAMRKRSRLPDKSYDLDGDGCVGVREYYMAAMLDKDVSGSLTIDEKRQGLANMREQLSNVMFVDNAGKRDDRDALNQYRIIQQDGNIILDQQ